MLQGVLSKMEVAYQGSPNVIEPSYSLNLGRNAMLNINSLVGKTFSMRYLGEIYCISCGRKTSKSFGQGYCYPCSVSVPQTEECVLKPELCRAHEGVARDMDFAREHCLIDHVVYLAWSGGLKVGVTRHHQVPIRWIDQGATRAAIVCRTPNRYTAGQIEVELKSILRDKTNWQAMLKGKEDNSVNLFGEKAKALEYINGKGFIYRIEGDMEYRIQYPLANPPTKIISTNLDNEPIFEGVLAGVKGQYLILESGRVLNVRSYSGYLVSIVT
jgi:hypothetical protein